MLTRSERIRMAHPLVVHCKRARYDVYIGRPSRWGNPFHVGRDGTRAQVIARYERWLEEHPELLARLAAELEPCSWRASSVQSSTRCRAEASRDADVPAARQV